LLSSYRLPSLQVTTTPTFAAIKRITRDTALATWTDQWKDHLNNGEGRFKIANRFPPSLKAREHFTDTERSVYGRMVQCRTGHCFAGEYYAKFVPSEQTSCPCGARRQSRYHIICECPSYETTRRHLHKPNEEISLTDVLGTKKGPPSPSAIPPGHRRLQEDVASGPWSNARGPARITIDTSPTNVTHYTFRRQRLSSPLPYLFPYRHRTDSVLVHRLIAI